MKTFAYILMAGAAVSFFGCNGGDSKPMPSADQKSVFQEVDASAARAQGAIPTNGTGSLDRYFMHGAISAAMSGDSHELVSALTSASRFRNDDLRAKMRDRLQEAVDSGDCKISKTGLDGETSGQINPASAPSGSLGVDGARCPVSFKLSLSTNKYSDIEFSIDYSLEYSVSDESYRELNDVDAIQAVFRFGVVASDTSATISAVLDQSVHSRKYGEVTETGRGMGRFDRDGGRFEMNVSNRFASFSIDRSIAIEADNSGAKNTRYRVNGNDVSQEEFNSYGEIDAPSGI